MVIVLWFVFLNFYLDDEYSSSFKYDNLYNQQQEIEKIVNFLNSEDFNKLVFTPNPAIFNPIPVGNISPFLINNNKKSVCCKSIKSMELINKFIENNNLKEDEAEEIRNSFKNFKGSEESFLLKSKLLDESGILSLKEEILQNSLF